MTEELANLPELEQTINTYGLPIPEDTVVQGLLYETPSHSGPYRGAVDIAVEIGTPILSPLEGTVVYVRDENDKHGPTAEFAKYNNFIEIKHANGEYSRLSHLIQHSSLVKVGDEVIEGQQVAKCGLVGATTRPHVHFMIFKKVPEKPGFRGLRVRFKQPLEDLIKE